MPGTHRCGRIDHVMVGGQQGADPERVHLLQSRFPVVPVELERGKYLQPTEYNNYYDMSANVWEIS